MIPQVKSTKKGKHNADFRGIKFSYNDFEAQIAVFSSRYSDLGYSNMTDYVALCDVNFTRIESVKPGSYELTIPAFNPGEVSSQEITIRIKVPDSEGAANALTTLYKLIRNGRGIVEEQTITDYPDYAHRGFQIDIARHFMNRDDIEDIIDKMSLIKLNRCHLYFSDDWGYRLESKLFPELNEIASWYIDNGTRTGGFLTHDDVRHIVAFASARGIEVIPEIDMPGHVTSFLATYPELGCFNSKVKVQNTAGISKDVLCVSKKSTYDFIFKLLDEVLPLFKYEYFHIGGDEVPTDNWCACESCQALMKANGMNTEGELQFLFMNRVIDYLNAKGKKIICWNDILRTGQFPDNAMVHYWCEPGFELDPKDLKSNQRFIYSFCRAFYYDFRDTTVTLENTYAWETRLVNGDTIPKENIAGFECENWAEFTYTKHQRLAKMFPRVYALSERSWNDTGDINMLKELIKEEEKYGTYIEENMEYANWLEEIDADSNS